MRYIAIMPTYSCNMNCPFCLFYFNKKKVMSLALFKKIIKQIKPLGYDTIALTGGEPIMHPKFNDLIELIINENLDFGIASNGYEYKKYANLLKKYKGNLKYIAFSLDSHKEKIHDKLRKKGSFKKTIEAIKLFSKEGINVKVAICLNKQNYKDIQDYIFFIEKLGVKDIKFLSVIATKKNKLFVLTDNERGECCKKINDLRDKVEVKLRILSSLNTPESTNFCSALDLSALTINPNGELIFCCDINGKGAILGSLKNNKLADLIKKGHKISNYLIEKKKEHLYTNTLFEGFNTCFFCNKYLKEKINI